MLGSNSGVMLACLLLYADGMWNIWRLVAFIYLNHYTSAFVYFSKLFENKAIQVTWRSDCSGGHHKEKEAIVCVCILAAAQPVTMSNMIDSLLPRET